MSETSDTMLCGTRKGLLTLRRRASGWRRERVDFLGIPVVYACSDPRDGSLWTSLDHGHWGQKLHRSIDGGVTWEELTPPAYREGDEMKPGEPATLKSLWVIEPGHCDEPRTLFIGTEPGGLFRSVDGGETSEPLHRECTIVPAGTLEGQLSQQSDRDPVPLIELDPGGLL